MKSKDVLIACVLIMALGIIIFFDVNARRDRTRAIQACKPYEMVSIVDEAVICKTADGGTELKKY